MSTTATPNASTIGIFDSGVGGLSVLAALHRMGPRHPLHYVADSGHAPYGDRDPAHVVDRSLRVADHLKSQGAQMLVVACNTATAWAIDRLRQSHPDLLLVGVEPGVKPAAARSRSGTICVMATPSTLSSPRFAQLVQRHAPDCHVLPLPCPGLAAAIEAGPAAHDRVEELLDMHMAPLSESDADVVVLGCTHYPFVRDSIAARLSSGVALLDTADAVARQAMRLMGESTSHEANHETWPAVRLQSTGDTEVLRRLALAGLGLDQAVERIKL
jgi:glutamate racemase